MQNFFLFFFPPARFASLFDEPRNPISWRWRWRWRLTLKTMLTLKFDNAARGDTNWKLDSKLYLITNEWGDGKKKGNGRVGVEVEVAATIFCLVSFRDSSFFPFVDWTIDNQITNKCGYIERQSKLYTCVCVCVCSLNCQARGYGWVGRTTCETGERRKAEGFLVSRNDVLVKDSCAARAKVWTADRIRGIKKGR